MRRIFGFILLFFFLLFLWNSGMLAVRIHRGMELARTSKPFVKENSGAVLKIAVIGDSTAVGTGTTDGAFSIAGRMAGEYPAVAILNLGKDGERFLEVIMQLNKLPDRGFDILLLQAGRNDILRFTPSERLEREVAEALDIARKKSRHVFFMGTGNVGIAPAFFPPVSWLYTERTRKARSLFMSEAKNKGVEYVDLFRERDQDPFLRDPAKYYASDGLHPGNEGYGVWYGELMRQTSISSLLWKAGRSLNH